MYVPDHGCLTTRPQSELYRPSGLCSLGELAAVAGGLITPPLLIGALAPDNETADIQTHLVASSLIVSGICTIIHVCPCNACQCSASHTAVHLKGIISQILA